MMSDKFNPNQSQTRKTPSLPLTRLGGNAKPAHASIYLLADHLDAVLAASEDIVTAHLTWNRGRRAGDVELTNDSTEIRDAIEHIRKLENLVIMRVLKSRERAEEVARVDKRFRQLAKLYTAGTAVLVDAVAECSDSTEIDFATADTVAAYMRSRGLIDPEAPAPAIGEDVPVGEEFLIAKRIAAGPLMDLSATLLDALELHYDLFLDDNEMALPPQVNRFDDTAASETADDPDPLAEAISQIREEAATDHPDDNPEIWARLAAGAVSNTSVDQVTDADAKTDDSEATDDPWARELGLNADDADLDEDDALQAHADDDGHETEEVESASAGTVIADDAPDTDLDQSVELADDQSQTDTPERDVAARVEVADEPTVETDASAEIETSEAEAATDCDDDDNTDAATSEDNDQPNIFEADTEIVMLSSRRADKDANTEPEPGAVETQTETSANETSGDDNAPDSEASASTDGDLAAAEDEDDDGLDDGNLIITAANDDEDHAETDVGTTSDDDASAADSTSDSAVSTSSEGDDDTAELTVANDDTASEPEQGASDSKSDDAVDAGETKTSAPRSLLSRLRGLKK